MSPALLACTHPDLVSTSLPPPLGALVFTARYSLLICFSLFLPGVCKWYTLSVPSSVCQADPWSLSGMAARWLQPRMTLTERLREKISQAFYNHGLFCASYPIPIILFTGLCILACWYVSKLPWIWWASRLPNPDCCVALGLCLFTQWNLRLIRAHQWEALVLGW